MPKRPSPHHVPGNRHARELRDSVLATVEQHLVRRPRADYAELLDGLMQALRLVRTAAETDSVPAIGRILDGLEP